MPRNKKFSQLNTEEAILSYYEHNASSSKERKQCVEYSHQQGGNTSVVVETILDSLNITPLIDELLPFLRDAIYIAHIDEITKNADAGVKAAVYSFE